MVKTKCPATLKPHYQCQEMRLRPQICTQDVFFIVLITLEDQRFVMFGVRYIICALEHENDVSGIELGSFVMFVPITLTFHAHSAM